jgi:hypothetical protein
MNRRSLRRRKILVIVARFAWDKEIEHSVRIARTVLSHLTTKHPELFRAREVAWYVATDEDVPR